MLVQRCAVLKARGEAPSGVLTDLGAGPSGAGLTKSPVALARGKHLFPFRTEQLSPSAPMVLGPQGPGRVGRRRFFTTAPLLRGRFALWAGSRRDRDRGRRWPC